MLGEPLGGVAETTRGDHDRTRADLVVAHRDSCHPSALHEQPVDTAPERDVDVGGATAAVEHVDDPLPATDRHVHPRHPLVAAEHQLFVELDTQVAQPLDGRTGELGEPLHDRGVDVPPVELQVVVVERGGIVLDALGALVARAGAHDEAARQPRRTAHHTLGLGHQHPASASCPRRERRAEPGRARPDDHDVDVVGRHVRRAVRRARVVRHRGDLPFTSPRPAALYPSNSSIVSDAFWATMGSSERNQFSCVR